MEDVHYSELEEKLSVSITHLFENGKEVLKQIEQGIHEKIKKAPVVGYQGVPGAYGEQATFNFFKGAWSECIAHEEFEDVFKALNEGKIDYGVVPIENSSAGDILDNYDLLKKYSVYIVGEVSVKVEHNLLGVKGAKLEDITEIISHPQALSQSKEFLKNHKDKKTTAYVNTAAACQYVSELGDKTKAAIGSRRAGELYNLSVIEKDIQFNKNNFTRFIVLAKRMYIDYKCNKISIVFVTDHVSGSLYNVLGHFAYNGLNLLKIQSRPFLEKKWEYYFFADLEGNLQDANVLVALSRIKEQSRYFKILGNYKQDES